MARNKLNDLNDHLFAQLERLGDEDLSPDDLEKEVKRANAIKGVSSQIIAASKVTLQAISLTAHGKFNKNELPEHFGLNQLDKL